MSDYPLTTSSVIYPFYSTDPGLAHARAAKLTYALGAIYRTPQNMTDRSPQGDRPKVTDLVGHPLSVTLSSARGLAPDKPSTRTFYC